MGDLAIEDRILREQLSRLGVARCLAFAAACCERMLPNYRAFQSDADWGNIRALEESLELIWSSIGVASFQTDRARELLQKCADVTPDTEDFHSVLVSSALDAAAAICLTLSYLLSLDVQRIVEVVHHATDTVYMRIQVLEKLNPNLPDFEHHILAHPLMQREVRKQRDDLEKLQNVHVLDEEWLKGFRRSWQNGGKSNIDLA